MFRLSVQPCRLARTTRCSLSSNGPLASIRLFRSRKVGVAHPVRLFVRPLRPNPSVRPPFTPMGPLAGSDLRSASTARCFHAALLLDYDGPLSLNGVRCLLPARSCPPETSSSPARSSTLAFASARRRGTLPGGRKSHGARRSGFRRPEEGPRTPGSATETSHVISQRHPGRPDQTGFERPRQARASDNGTVGPLPPPPSTATGRCARGTPGAGARSPASSPSRTPRGPAAGRRRRTSRATGP